jgi:branched-chain amino acid transport system permease protein
VSGAVFVFLAAVPWVLGRGQMSVLMEFFYYLALAQMWNLLAGFAGIVSLGQQAFIGLGGYVLFFCSMQMGMHPLVALLVAGIVGAVVAVPAAVAVFRLQGAYQAIGTWVLAEVFGLVFSQIMALGAGSGLSLSVQVARHVKVGAVSRDGVLYLIALLLGVLATVGSYTLLRSKTGLLLTAIRDNEPSARTGGVSSQRVKLAVFVGTSFGTALTGALIYLSKLRISPTAAFDINWTSYMTFIVVIGGIGTLEGPIVGTIVFFLLREYLSNLGSWYLVILGALAVVVMLWLPEGLWGTCAGRFNISLFPTQRRLILDGATEEKEQMQNKHRGVLNSI